MRRFCSLGYIYLVIIRPGRDQIQYSSVHCGSLSKHAICCKLCSSQRHGLHKVAVILQGVPPGLIEDAVFQDSYQPCLVVVGYPLAYL